MRHRLANKKLGRNSAQRKALLRSLVTSFLEKERINTTLAKAKALRPLVRKNDTVIVISGKDKGKTGKVLKVIPEKRKIIIEKINFIKEFIRRDQSKNVQGGIMEKESPLHVSNVMLYCAECAQGVRVKNMELEDGSRVRVCKKCDITIEKQL